nr:hypothetical protein [Tanacetum cinerariifolium]
KFSNITKGFKEDYHSIKDDVLLVSVYTTGYVLVRGMLILNAFLTVEIRETDDFKEYETEEIDKVVDGDEDEESYASAFVDSVFNNDVDDTGSTIEPGIHKEHPEHVSDDDQETKKKKVNVEIGKEKNDDINVEESVEIVKEKDIREVLDHCNKVVPDVTLKKTKEMITQEMPRLVNLAVNKDREVDPINAKDMIAKSFSTHGPKMIEDLFRKHMHYTTLNLYPTTSSSSARKSSVDPQQQLFLTMKSKPQDQTADPKIWEILKSKFEKP